MGPHISIKGEIITEFFGFPITNSFITTLLVLFVFFFIARFYNSEIEKKDRSLGFYALHGMITWLYDMFKSVLGKNINTFFTLVGGFFFFILLLNWSGLIPGVGSILISPPLAHEEEVMIEEGEAEHGSGKIPLLRGGTADLNTTLALALISVLGTQLFGFKFLGPINHLKKYFDFRDPIMILLGPLEIIGEIARIVSFAFRLYGNIFAGEVLLTIIPFLLPVFLSFVVSPLFFMEIFVGLVQALVFAMLSTVFINMAISTHH
ncbi:MAG: F0F1 ATP synthase subunit A [bacterium]|nr:F0F1 ATP synthase subunit A [bacterium]